MSTASDFRPDGIAVTSMSSWLHFATRRRISTVTSEIIPGTRLCCPAPMDVKLQASISAAACELYRSEIVIVIQLGIKKAEAA